MTLKLTFPCTICAERFCIEDGYLVVHKPAERQEQSDTICMKCWLGILRMAWPAAVSEVLAHEQA